MANLVARYCREKSAATAIEYSLIAGLIALAIVAGASSLGSTLEEQYGGFASEIEAARQH